MKIIRLDHSSQSGAALIVSLVILLVLTIVGLGAMRSSLLSERMSANSQQRQITFNAAQSANNAFLKIARDKEYGLNGQIVDILWETRQLADLTDIAHHNNSFTRCYDKSISAKLCSTHSDFGVSGLRTQTQSLYRGCKETPPTMCANYSADLPFKCHMYEVNGFGWYDTDGNEQPDADEISTHIEQTMTHLGLCAD